MSEITYPIRDLALQATEVALRNGVSKAHQRKQHIDLLHKKFLEYRDLLPIYAQAHVPCRIEEYRPLVEGTWIAQHGALQGALVVVLNRIKYLHALAIHTPVKEARKIEDRFDHEAARIERHLRQQWAATSRAGNRIALLTLKGALDSWAFESRTEYVIRPATSGAFPELFFYHNNISLPLAEVLRRVDAERAERTGQSCDDCTNACEGGSCK